MEKYLGVKLIEATPMTKGQYHVQREILLPKGENPNEEGYLVRYEDGYVSWSPKDVFEKAYRKTDGLTFGLAIEALKKGYKVARSGWNGKGMFLLLVEDWTVHEKYIKDVVGLLPVSFIAMKTVNDDFIPWLASQTDVLSEDWIIVD